MLDFIMLALGLGFFAFVSGLRLRLRSALRRATMIFDYTLAGLVSAGAAVLPDLRSVAA